MDSFRATIASLVTWWDSKVPGVFRDLVEGAVSAGIGSAYLASQNGINLHDPKAAALILVSAFTGAAIGYVRHHLSDVVKFILPASVIAKGRVEDTVTTVKVSVENGTATAVVPVKQVAPPTS